MRWAIGDLQGCSGALDLLLHQIDFNPGVDELYFCGDLVNRGPDSLGTLQRLQRLGSAARCVLGNHDLHLLAVSAGARVPSRLDTIAPILNDKAASFWLDWLRHQSLILRPDSTHLVVHAGLLPQWTPDQALSLGDEVETMLRSSNWRANLQAMYGNEPARWDNGLQGPDRMRVIVNAMTRLRFCTDEGVMEFKTKDGSDQAPAGYKPWFECAPRQSASMTIVFGHWSTLGLLNRPTLLGLDTGCVWGGQLTAASLPSPAQQRQIVQVSCEQACRPGA